MRGPRWKSRAGNQCRSPPLALCPCGPFLTSCQSRLTKQIQAKFCYYQQWLVWVDEIGLYRRASAFSPCRPHQATGKPLSSSPDRSILEGSAGGTSSQEKSWPPEAAQIRTEQGETSHFTLDFGFLPNSNVLSWQKIVSTGKKIMHSIFPFHQKFYSWC